MKPLSLHEAVNESPSERLDRAFRTVIKVPKEALLKEEAKEKHRHQKKRNKKTS
jgi:hypothetical protein